MISGNKILLVGCGNMGGALLNGWSKEKLDLRDVSIIEPALLGSEKSDRFVQAGIATYEGLADMPEGYKPDVVFLAVKPQVMDQLLPDYNKPGWEEVVFVSIAAGKPLEYLENNLGEKAAIIRAMPNLPALIASSVTVAVPNKNVTDKQKHTCDALLEVVGHVHWLEDESMMSAVTALSGSGPAYVFYFIESLINAGVKAGLDPELAKFLAYETVMGTAKLSLITPEPLSVWRERVTSPGGTTEAALNVLMAEDKFSNLLAEAVQAAANRSEELK